MDSPNESDLHASEIIYKLPDNTPARYLANGTFIFAAYGCALTERQTKSGMYVYTTINLTTGTSVILSRRKRKLDENGFPAMAAKISALPFRGKSRLCVDKKPGESAREFALTETAKHIFKEILPQHGYAVRENQVKLAEHILDITGRRSITLAESEVGTGKTHAYLVAAALAKRGRLNDFWLQGCYPSQSCVGAAHMPVVISTSSIALQKAIDTDYIPELSRILLLHGVTGMRIGELCALDINDINREQKYIDITKSAGRRKDKYTGEVSIKVGPPKTKHSRRRIPLLPSVEVMLDRQIQLAAELQNKAGEKWKENTLIFPTDEGNIHDLSGLRSSIGRVLKRAGLPHMTIHALRHTYATTALNAGVAAQNVARLLGHKDGATTLKFYAHYLNTEAMIQLEKLEKQNITNLGITANDLERIMTGAAESLEKVSVAKKIDDSIMRAKNFPPKKSVEMVLSVCEDILCQPLDELSAAEKEILLCVLGRYTVMKRQLDAPTVVPQKTKSKKIEAPEL